MLSFLSDSLFLERLEPRKLSMSNEHASASMVENDSNREHRVSIVEGAEGDEHSRNETIRVNTDRLKTEQIEMATVIMQTKDAMDGQNGHSDGTEMEMVDENESRHSVDPE